jgi:hypothetical protein
MFFCTSAGLVDWNSQVVPHPQTSTPASMHCLRTVLRSSFDSDGSTPCLWPVRNSTGPMPTDFITFRIVGKSHCAAML